MPYSPLLVKPMRDEVTDVGVTELLTPEDVDKALTNTQGTALLFFNSVCGCAASSARPGLRMALENKFKPDKVYSVFAGQELEATARARAIIPEIPPSSPSIAIFKDGELVYFMPKHRIEGRDAHSVANDLTALFDELCPPPS